MVTIVSEIGLKDGAGEQWDALMRERMAAAKDQPGWVGGQLLKPDGDPGRRVIVGTWRSRDDWRAWHTAPDFQATRAKLDALVRGPEAHAWHDVVVEQDGPASDAAGARRPT